ncbi:type VI secretion system tip protein VgrG [Ekhidna sp.]
MSISRTLPIETPTDLITYTILIEGEKIKPEHNVIGIFTSKSVGKIPTARLILDDGSIPEEDFELSSTDTFLPGKKIEIQVGYNSEDQPLFKGVIVKHGVRVKNGKSSQLVLDCKDEAVKMTIGRKNNLFYESKDSEIIEEIIGTYGLTSEIEPTTVSHTEMVQYNVSDWDFVMLRADANGYLVMVNDGNVVLSKPDTSTEPKLGLLYGETIKEFEGEIDARNQFGAIKSYSWDAASQSVLEMEGTSPGLTKPGNLNGELSEVMGLESLNLFHGGQIADAEMTAWANGHFLRSDLSPVRGKVMHEGFSDIEVGDMIELGGLGDRFNGKAFVSGVSHTVSEGDWNTELQFGLDPDCFTQKVDVSAPAASGIIPPIKGLHIGIVTQLSGDPDGEERILVKVPLINDQEDGIWARMTHPDAGNNRGLTFWPEVGDEVILGFLNDDPRNPIILGSLYSSSAPPAIAASDENPEKGIITKSEMKIVINDESKSLEISTPSGNLLSLSEETKGVLIEDQNGNKIEMTADGVTIESAADLKLVAAGDLLMEGTNIEGAASAEWKCEGGSGAEFASGAIAVIKGSMVQIN